jgi:tRNA (guanine-N7-)-methyltransferase
VTIYAYNVRALNIYAMMNTPKQETALEAPKKAFIKTYSRKGGRNITEVKTGLLKEFLPQININATEQRDLIAKELFPNAEQVWLEIGFGCGEHLVAHAETNPNVGLVGCEVYLRAFSTCLKQVYDKSLSNVKLFNDDARMLLESITDEQLDRIFLLFPDPWPKKRHIKRRMVNPQTLDIFFRVLKKGGTVRVATDHNTYKEHTLETFKEYGKFKPLFKSEDELTLQPQDHFQTRYQAKNLAGAKQAFFMDFVK